ncbi:proline dehydrogenase family protein [candidate division KSB1 bacterium]|nr:proline dehydrogenase family protein [candidate division KSB1 bacterium]
MRLFNLLVVWFLPLVPKPIVRLFSKPYVAGPKLEDAVQSVKDLNSRGIMATLDVLGESAQAAEECAQAVEEYLTVLDTIQKENLDSNISIKLTQLGLNIDPEFCYDNIRKIVAKAAETATFVRVDMEDSSVTTLTIDLFLRLQKDFSNVGIVIQSYLRRSLDDVTDLLKTHTNFRVCKGIYVEPRQIAYKDPQTVNDNFTLLVETALKNGSYVGIATHDEKLVWQGLRIVHELGLKKEDYEFQMLLGVDEELRDIIVRSGHHLRVYVPFGKHWHAYCVRRLKENPKIALYVIKALFGLR